MDNESNNDFGNYLRQKRKEKKLTTRRLGELSGISHTYISQFETGKRSVPSPDILQKMSDPLGVPYEELLRNAGYLGMKELRNILVHSGLDEFSQATDINNFLEESAEYYTKVLLKLYKSRQNDKKLGDLIFKHFGLFKDDTPEYIVTLLKKMGPRHQLLFVFETIDLIKKYYPDDFVNDLFNVAENTTHYNINNNDSLTTLKVPILGNISAGLPILAEEQICEWMEIPNLWNSKDGELFILVVKGDSMIGSRIQDGDKVVVKIQPEVETGEIAVVNVNGNDATLKRVKKIDGQVILFPDNPKYEPIFIKNENARIIGKVVQVMFEP